MISQLDQNNISPYFAYFFPRNNHVFSTGKKPNHLLGPGKTIAVTLPFSMSRSMSMIQPSFFPSKTLITSRVLSSDILTKRLTSIIFLYLILIYEKQTYYVITKQKKSRHQAAHSYPQPGFYKPGFNAFNSQQFSSTVEDVTRCPLLRGFVLDYREKKPPRYASNKPRAESPRTALRQLSRVLVIA